MGNAVDKTFRALSPVTWVDTALNNKTSYDCPVCGREVWAYGSMVGTKCLSCPGRSTSSSSYSHQISTLQSTITTHEATISSQGSTISTYKTAEDNLKKEAKKNYDSAEQKMNDFKPKVEAFKNKYNGSCDIKFDESAKSQLDTELQQTESLMDKMKTAIDATTESIEFSKDLGTKGEETPTYSKQGDMEQFTQQCQDAQAAILKKKGVINDQINAGHREQIKLDQKEIDLKNDAIKAKEDEIKLNDDESKMGKLRLELTSMTGAEMRANSEAYNKMKQAFDGLLAIHKQKCADNQNQMNLINECQKRVVQIRKKLEKQQLDNKYLVKVLDEEYKALSAAIDCAMEKFEERGTYFLSVTCGLKSDIIEFMEDMIGDDHDMEMIMMLNNDHLMEMGVQNEMLRVKIMNNINKLKSKQ